MWLVCPFTLLPYSRLQRRHGHPYTTDREEMLNGRYFQVSNEHFQKKIRINDLAQHEFKKPVIFGVCTAENLEYKDMIRRVFTLRLMRQKPVPGNSISYYQTWVPDFVELTINCFPGRSNAILGY